MVKRWLLALVIICVNVASADELRTWTSRAGGFTVEATLIDLTDGKVVLKKRDGSTVSVPLEKLSLGDVRYLDQVMRDAEQSVTRSATEAIDSPAMQPSDPVREVDNDEATAPSLDPAGDPDSIDKPESDAVADVQTGAPPLAEPNRSDWQVAPDAGNIGLVSAARRLSIPIQSKIGSVQTLISEVASPFVGVFQQGSPSFCECYDLRSGRKVGQVELGNSYLQHKALSPDGRVLAWHSPGKESLIQLVAVSGSKRVTQINFSKDYASVNFLAFAGSDRLLVGDSSVNQFSVWSTKTQTKLTEFPMPTGTDAKLISLSHGGNYLAVGAYGGAPIRLFDTRNGAIAGSLPLPEPEAGSNQMVSLVSLAFSMDGSELAAIYSVGSSSGLAWWGLRDGQLIKNLDFGKPLTSMIRGTSYDGAVLQYLPDEKGWLLYGRGVIDRKVGGVAWEEPRVSGSTVQSARRQVLADGRLVALRGPYSAVILSAEALPWDEIEQGSKVVATGGMSEDAKLPELSRPKINLANQKTFIESPQWQAKEPASKKVNLRVRPISIDASPLLMRELQFASDSNSHFALAVVPSKTKTGLQEGFQPTVLMRFELQSARLTGTLDTNQPGEFIGVNESGKLAITRTGKNRDRLDLYEIESGNHLSGFRPDASEQRPAMVMWAGFNRADSLITLSSTGRMVIWEIPSFTALAVTRFDFARDENYVPITCWMSPSREILVIAAAGKLQAVDAGTLQSLGTLQSTPSMRGPWSSPAVAFDPTGRSIAAEIKNGDQNTLAVWDFTSGQLTGEFAIERPGLGLSWADDRYLLIHGIRIPNRNRPTFSESRELSIVDMIDSQQGALVWRYVIPFGQAVQRGPDHRIWYASATSMLSPGILMGVEIPTPTAQAALKSLPPRTPLLQQDSEVTLDVKFQSPSAPAGLDLITDSIIADLSRQLIDRGVQVKPRAGLMLRVAIKEVPTNNRRRFLMLATGQEVSVQETRVDCDLTLTDVTGKPLWQRSQSFHNEGQRLIESVPAGTTVVDHLRRLQWKEVLQWFETGGLPEKIYEPFPASGLGESVLGPTGETNAKVY